MQGIVMKIHNQGGFTMSYRKGRESFTLIELLIVIAIITISLSSNF